MSRFEYLSVLVSIVIALGVTEVTISWGRLLQQRVRVRFDWLHAYWSLFTLFLMIQFWWGFWNFRVVEAWSLGALLAVVVQAMTLVLCALVLTPSRSDIAADAGIDLRSLYREQARLFFVLGAALLVLLTWVDVRVLGTPLLHVENAVRALGIGLALVAARFGSPRLHAAIPVGSAALLLAFLLAALEL